MSSQRKVSIQAEIYKTLVEDCLDGFTLPELRDAYVDQGGSILRLFFVHQAYDVKNLGEK